MQVFENAKEQIKAAVREEVEHFCDMLDCTDEPPGLEYNVEKFGVKIKIVAGLSGGA